MREPAAVEPTLEIGNEGKAARRLELFETARGVESTNVAPKQRTRRSRGESAPPDAALAATYAEVATEIASPPAAPAPAPGGGLDPPTPNGTAQWRSIGPTDIPDGQTYGSGPGSRVNVSGRVAAIAVDPANGQHVLVGAAGGGVWETRDGGATWAPRTDQQPTLTTGAIAFDPGEPTTVYAGTGEGNFYRRLGAGLLRSQDGGTTWALHAGAPFVGQGFFDLVVDPSNASHLLAGTTGGVYESADGGATWTRRRAQATWSLSQHPTNPAEFLAACADGIFRSTNGGQTWSAVSLSGMPSTIRRLAVAHAPSDGRIAYVFGASATQGFLWRRATTGNWSAVTPPSTLSVKQAWYDWFLGVAADNPGQIYLGEIHMWRGDLSGSSWSWTNVSSKAGGDSIHPDQHAIAFAAGAPDVVWVGNDGGVFVSPNRGVSWRHRNTGLAITEIEYVAQNRGDARWLLAGTQDNGTIRYDGSATWLHSQDGDGGDCAVNAASPATVFHTFFGMGMQRSTSRGDKNSWVSRGPNVAETYNALFYPPVEANDAVIAQAGESLFVSTDAATSWTEVQLNLGGAVGSALAIPTATRIYVGTNGGDVLRADRSGATWSVTRLTRPRSGFMSDLLVDPTNPSRLWATFSDVSGAHAFRSDDGGTTWQDRSAGLPPIPANAVEVDPQDGNRVWIAADVGVWQSLDGGATWAAFGSGLPNALAADLLLHPTARLLRVGTRNRGTWEIEVDAAAVELPAVGVQWTGTVPANGSRTWFTGNWPASWHVLWTVIPTTVRPGAPQVRWIVQVERTSAEFVTYRIVVTNLTASPVDVEGRWAVLSRH